MNYQLIALMLLAFYVAWNLGANDVANSMGTSVGSKALTLKQALIVAGILEFTGAVIFGQRVTATLATEVVNPVAFVEQPQTLLWGMVAVLIACGIWLQVATHWGLPVASSHAVVGAIAGFSIVALGVNAVNWLNLGRIGAAWLLTPVLSASIAALLYYLLSKYLFKANQPLWRLREWIPWLSFLVFGIFGLIVLPTLLSNPLWDLLPVSRILGALSLGGIAVISLTIGSWNYLEGLQLSNNDNSDKKLEIKVLERVLGKFQIVSACFVAFAHGSNDVGNAIAPLATILHILKTQSVPTANIDIPLWLLILGACGIVTGLAIHGKQVIKTVGEKIIALQPSSGFCAELSTAITILLASSLGLPVSTSHALVGAVVGIGLIQNWQQVSLSTVKSVILAWIVTLPIAAGISGGLILIFQWQNF